MPRRSADELKQKTIHAANNLEQKGLAVTAIEVGRQISSSKLAAIEKVIVEWRAAKKRASLKMVDLRHTPTIPELLKTANDICIRSNLTPQKRDQVLMRMKKNSHDYRAFVSSFETQFVGKVLVVGKPWERN